MIQRYTEPEMAQVFSSDRRFYWMLEVEKAVADVQAELGIIPADANLAIQKKARFDLLRIEEIEKTTKHDVIAFVSSVAESIGPEGRWVHFGLTSSDVLDTALSLQIGEAGRLVMSELDSLIENLKTLSRREARTLCAGRTHGMHAEPTTFGMKMAGFWVEFQRDRVRLARALEGISIAKLSGAVGTYSTQTEEVELRVANRLGLKPETVATQVIPRDRHAEVMCALAILGGAIERLAVELRHLQRTEVGEVIEGFSAGQKGSSAMPHKKNPISAENLTGLSRLLRSYAQASLEDIALWHERDISHSSVERVIVPDAFIIAHYALRRMGRLLTGLYVDSDRMRSNLKLSRGTLMSSHLLLALVDRGLSREDAYARVQSLSHGLSADEDLQSAVNADPQLGKLLTPKEVETVFSGEKHIASIEKQLARLGLFDI